MQGKKIILTILALVFLAGVGFFVFLKFTTSENAKNIASENGNGFVVQSTSIGRSIAVDDAALVPVEDLHLAFEMGGKIQKVLVTEGQNVNEGDMLIQLDATQLAIVKRQAEAGVTQARANLDKLINGLTEADLKVLQAGKKSADESADALHGGVLDALQGSFTAADDAVRGRTNVIFDDPDGTNPQLNITVSDSDLESTIEASRRALNTDLESFKSHVNGLGSGSDPDKETSYAKDFLNEVAGYLTNVAKAVDVLTTSSGLTQDQINDLQTAVSTGRGEVDIAKGALAKGLAKFSLASGAFSVATKDYKSKTAGPRPEDIAAATAQVDVVRDQLSLVNEQITKTTLTAPHAGMVSKIWFKEGEIDPAGQPVISFRSSEMKIQADVSEKDILKVAVGSNVRVKFKALAQTTFSGKVDAIEAHEINKDGDIYYRVNIGSSDFTPPLRSGMTADVSIDSAGKDTAIRIPSSYISWRAGHSYVTVVNAGKQQEVEVEAGATDGDSTEISSGLQEGQQLLSP